MKILYYNWVDYLDPEKRGGGVNVYQRSLLETLKARGTVEAHFISSGIAHEFMRKPPRWVELPKKNPGGDPARRFEIVNSGIMAPSHAHYGSPGQISHPETEAVFMDFVARNGPYDVIHFNNLEGLPANTLRLKERWPQTRVVLSLHNYYPFCPQVNLWRNETKHCDDFAAGRRCETCLPVVADPDTVRLLHAVSWRMHKAGMGPGTAAFDKGFRPILGMGWRTYRKFKLDRPQESAPGDFAGRRRNMVDLINHHVDAVLCVSDRVRQIAAHFGVAGEKLITSYIGTAEAAKWEVTEPRSAILRPDGTVHLAYLGYMRRDKGFFFLLDALEALPDTILSRLRLTVAARHGDWHTMARIKALGHDLAELRLVDGYTHAGLDALLAEVDLGLVPVLWEDNLPQVAIEMHARHIPLITSDRGGAQELGRCPALTFRSGDKADLARVLNDVLDGRIDPADYWKNAMAPMTMKGHVDELLAVYEGQS